jgi:hypothetical protein
MPGNPRECREHAARCAELAVTARTSQMRITFLELAKNWENLAIQIEGGFGGPAETEDVWWKVQRSIDEALRLRKQ